MSEEYKCKCKINKTYNPNDPECIRCKNSQKLLKIMLDIAIEKAVKEGNISLLSKIIDVIDK